ncbi:flagellar motor switch protein FliG [Erythrobacter sp. HL-111]|uniref:flagellar motor switch protein FliG n=1 Tax=Erythrobacter sp. HL-111 TaxID=1798193 RepID=UPI0006DBD6C9|nr:FliG C-terminal domain-containing protein [Erythrobacter sp. HL-111]KPP92579.1 MAG: flagellar motor switch protein FliG [Erythrobacteraceae bacterium HL-111]SDS92876.1 flagellar motor switch protein FliG [Erythrobacter sp. HL-111]
MSAQAADADAAKGQPDEAAPAITRAPLTRIERAAVFLMLLGDEEAAGLLARLDPGELQAVGAAMLALGEIDRTRMAEAIADFVAEAGREIIPARGRGAQVRQLIESALDPARAESMMQRIEPEGRPRMVELASWLAPAILVRLIEDEHPQVIAALLLLLDPDQAAEVLSALAEPVQAAVVERVARIGPVSLSAVAMIDDLLRQRIGASFGTAALTMGGPREAANLINRAAGDLKNLVLPAIAQRDAGLASRIEEELFTFEMLLDLDRQAMSRLLRDVDNDALVDALKGLGEHQRAPFFACMSSRAADGIRDEIELRGRIARSEVEAAQRRIVELARGLADAGEIVIGGDDGEFV